MTTLSRSLQMAAGGDFDEELEIAGRIICMRLFIGEGSDMLTVVVGDAHGKMIEAKTWSKSKANHIYRKFNEGDPVLLSCPINSIMEPDATFSDASYETFIWTLFNCEEATDIKSYVRCLTDIQDFHQSYKPAKTLAGLLIEIGDGPLKYDAQRKVVARGRYLKLKDTNYRMFRALVWECISQGQRSELDLCEAGDRVLLLYAREQNEYYRPETPSIYTVTTSYPPVINSQCINPAVDRELVAVSNVSFYDEYNPYIRPYSGYLCI